MKRTRKSGFTLLELIVVITIIGILGTFVVVNVAGMTDEARVAKAKNDVRAIYNAARAIELQTGLWPQSIEECVNPQSDTPVPGRLENYPTEPWKNEYIYQIMDDGPMVMSLGKDGQEGGEGVNADIIYPEVDEGY